jgi:hypothetical protein
MSFKLPASAYSNSDTTSTYAAANQSIPQSTSWVLENLLNRMPESSYIITLNRHDLVKSSSASEITISQRNRHQPVKSPSASEITISQQNCYQPVKSPPA